MKPVSILAVILLPCALLAFFLLHSHSSHAFPTHHTVATVSKSPQPAPAPQKNEAEPFQNILPGVSCENVRALLGKESEGDRYSLNWKLKDIEISVFPDSHCIVRSVMYFVKPGHRFATPDGVILGKDTIADAKAKLKDRISESSPFISEGEGHIQEEVELRPTSTFPFKSIYSWSLDWEKTEKLHREPLTTDFTTEPVEAYTVDTSPLHRPGEVPYD